MTDEHSIIYLTEMNALSLVLIVSFLSLSGCIHAFRNVAPYNRTPPTYRDSSQGTTPHIDQECSPTVNLVSSTQLSRQQNSALRISAIRTVYETPAMNALVRNIESNEQQIKLPSLKPEWLTHQPQPFTIYRETLSPVLKNHLGHSIKSNALSATQLNNDGVDGETWHNLDMTYSHSFFVDKKPNRKLFEVPLFERVISDHRNFYSSDSLFGLSYGFGVGGLMANTEFDQVVRDTFQESMTSSFLHAPKELGNGKFTIPVFAFAWIAGNLLEDAPGANGISEWGERSIRSLLVGAPPMLAAQYLTGGSRPGEHESGSHWKPFQDNNGVSGHSFIGAIPFLTAAQVAEEPWLKAALYAGSTLVPLSRINDDAHYASHAVLGWWIAFLATRAVDRTQTGDSHWRFAPFISEQGTGVSFEYRY